MRLPTRLALWYIACCLNLGFSCPPQESLRTRGKSPAYLDKCIQVGSGSEQWTVKIDFTTGPGGRYTPEFFTLPTPQQGFWLKSVHMLVTDKTGVKRFMWPPIHVHHFVCRTPRADAWYEQDVYEHQEVFLTVGGASYMNEHRKRYDLLNGPDGRATHYGDNTIVRCGLRMDDDRLAGNSQEYKLVVIMDVVIDPYRLQSFQPLGNTLWEGTPTGQIGYNVPEGISTVVSKEYEAPLAGSFHPDSFSSHTHPGGKSLKLMTKRLGGQDFASPQLLFTLQYPVWVLEAGPQSQELNMKPGLYVRQPAFEWSKFGLKWLNGTLSTSRFDSNQCAFEQGDIFYLEATHDAKNFMNRYNTMMALGMVVLWSEEPHPTPFRGVGRFLFSGFMRNQIFGQFLVPHDLLANIPQRINQSVMFELHSRMPSLFCHPDRAADFEYVECLRNVTEKAMFLVWAKDIDQVKLATRQEPCGQ